MLLSLAHLPFVLLATTVSAATAQEPLDPAAQMPRPRAHHVDEDAAAPLPKGAIEGRVLLPDGHPAPGAVVVTTAGGQAVTDEAGVFRLEVALPPGMRELQLTAVRAGDEESLRASVRAPAPVEGGVTEGGTLHLEPGEWCEPSWLPTFGATGRVNGEVDALLVFDDGTGPALYAGGSFTSVGGSSASYIAKWDGSSWSDFGAGLNGTVTALQVHDDGSGPALIVGGYFTTVAGVSTTVGVARWDGTSWSSPGNSPSIYCYAECFTVFDDGSGAGAELYAGGLFTDGGGTDSVRKWDGSGWSRLGTGLGTGGVYALQGFDDGGGGALYAGGYFTVSAGAPGNYIAKWDGTAWSAFAAEPGGYVSDFTVYDDGAGDDLYVAGYFSQAGSLGTGGGIARWDGTSWSSLGVGAWCYGYELTVADDGSGAGTALYMGGYIPTAGGTPTAGIARWDGTSWSALGTGTGGTYPRVHAIAEYDDGSGAGSRLYVGGEFTTAGSSPAAYLAQWDGAEWSALGDGMDALVRAVAVYDDGGGEALYAGGSFTTASGQTVNHIARWDGAAWSPLGSGLDGDFVHGLTVFDDGTGPALYVAGRFTSAGGVPANHVARWDGSAWSALGSGMNDFARVLWVHDDGTGGGPALYAGGNFTTSGGVTTNHIARWDGSAWSDVGGGTNGLYVLGLTTWDDGTGPALYAGGNFTLAGGVAANHVAKWDGTSWSPLGGGVSGGTTPYVWDLLPHDDGSGPALYASGSFTYADGLTVWRVARWNGSAWSRVGTGLGGTWSLGMAEYDDGTGDGPALYIGGDFTTAGAAAANRIARWDGVEWSPLGAGTSNGGVYDLTVFDDGAGPKLIAGGNFLASEAGDSYIARWGGCAEPEPEVQVDVLSREISFSTPGPDLAFDAQGFVLPTAGSVDQYFEVRWRVQNLGTEPAGAHTDRLVFSESIRLATGGSGTTHDAPTPTSLGPGESYERAMAFLMPAAPTTFTIELFSDVGGVVEEWIDTNNLFGPHEVTVVDVPRPNLEASVTAQPGPGYVAGDDVALSFKVWNDGTAPVNVYPWTDSVYVVRDVNDDGVPPASTSGAVASVGFPNLSFPENEEGGDGTTPGTFYERVGATIQIPVSAPAGSYFLGVRTDSSNTQIELDETDNLAWSSAFTVTEPLRPDLSVDMVGILGAVPGTPLPSGSTQTVLWDVSNLGPATFPVGGVTTQIWVSTDDHADATAFDDAVLLASFGDALPALGVGGSTSRSRDVWIPPDLPVTLMGGDYWFKVRLDPNDSVPEEETQGAPPHWNNLGLVGSYPVNLSATPDLVASSIGLAPGQGTPEAAHAIQVSFDVSNPEAPGWNVYLGWTDKVWLSVDDLLDGADLLLGSFGESTVQQGGEWVVPPSYSKSVMVTLPASTQPGMYYLILDVDVGNTVFEQSGGGNDNNVVASAAFMVESHPADLSIAAQAGGGAVLPSTAGASGQMITLPWTVTNDAGAGTTSTGSWTDRVYLSQDELALVGAVTVLSRAHSGALQPGESYEETRTASVPFDIDPDQSWWLHFRTDVGGVVFEGGATANNRVSVPFDVLPEIADLVVDAMSATPRMQPGELLMASWTVRNSGSAVTGASSWNDTVYLQDSAQTGPLVPLASVTRNGVLLPGSSYESSGGFALPGDLPTGAYDVVVRADAGGSVWESDDDNNDRTARMTLELEAPPPSNLVVSGVTILGSPVTAGQVVQLEWTVTNVGAGATNVSSWSDSVHLSLDGALGGGDPELGFHQHAMILGPGEARVVSAAFIVPLWANGQWVVIVETDPNAAVDQGGQEDGDVAASAGLLEVLTPPLTDLDVTDVGLPASALLGESLAFDWTTRNDSGTAIPAAWGWSDQFWLLPDGQSFPAPGAVALGQLASDADVIASGGMHQQVSSSLALPGITPGPYRLVVVTDLLNQVAELEEGDNVFTSTETIDLQAIPIASGGMAMADLASGSSRWFHVTTPMDQTLDLVLVHDDPNAKCELYVRGGALPNLGTFDFRSEGVDAVDPSTQTARIPRTIGADYFVLARTVSGAGAMSGVILTATEQPFEVTAVETPAVGAGVVTIAIQGGQLWRATSVELRDVSPGAGAESSLDHVVLADGTLLARFDLTGAPLGAREVVVVDGTAMVEAPWSGSLSVVAPAPLALGVELEVAPSIRRGEAGPATLRLTNLGNVDAPYSLASIGHARPMGAVDPMERIVVSSAALGIAEIESDGANDSLAFSIEDLRPGGVHELSLTLAVGGAFSLEEAALAVACRPASSPAFLGGMFDELSEALRVALAADPATPALLSGVAQDPVMWSQVVSAGLVSGSIPVNTTTIHTPDSVPRTARALVQAIADGVALELMLPPGAEPPASSIDLVVSSAGCSPFVGTTHDCEALFPVDCGQAAPSVMVSSQAGGNVPTGVVCTGTPAPDDPNEKLHPHGTGSQAMVNGGEPLRYEVHFENQESATAWASRVLITDALDVAFRSSSVRFHELRVGRTTIPFAPGTSSYLGQVPLSIDDETDVLCQISLTVDALSDTIFVVLQALDPMTGLPPSSGDVGLLPPSGEETALEATGYIAFSVLPDPTSGPAAGQPSLSAKRMKNKADIRFNAQVPIPTNETENMLDGGPPVSQLSLDSVVGKDIALSWTGDDTEALPGGPFPGSGVDRYTLFVTTDGGANWSPVLTDSPATSHVFIAEFGATYGIKVEATDAVGNAESKELPEVTVVMPADCNANDVPDDEDIAMGTSQDANGNGVPDECECTWSSYCVATANSTGQPALITGIGVPSLSTGSFTLSVSDLPPNESAMFLYGSEPAQIPFGDGFRCVQGTMKKLVPVLLTTGTGNAQYALDLQDPPVPLSAGDTGHFQLWYRDAAAAGAGFNLSDGLAVTFCD